MVHISEKGGINNRHTLINFCNQVTDVSVLSWTEYHFSLA